MLAGGSLFADPPFMIGLIVIDLVRKEKAEEEKKTEMSSLNI
jgi:hypothetical protein